jgi:hypothetical protein
MATINILPIGTGIVLRGKHIYTIINLSSDKTTYTVEKTGVTSHFPKGEKDWFDVREINKQIETGRYTTIEPK